MSVIKLILFLT